VRYPEKLIFLPRSPKYLIFGLDRIQQSDILTIK
jgi:hypothetical protein